MKMLSKANRRRKNTCWENALKTNSVFARFVGLANFGKQATEGVAASGAKKVYHDLTRRWWNKVKLPLDDWLRVVYQFHLRFVVVPAKKPPRFPKVNGGVERKKDASA